MPDMKELAADLARVKVEKAAALRKEGSGTLRMQGETALEKHFFEAVEKPKPPTAYLKRMFKLYGSAQTPGEQ